MLVIIRLILLMLKVVSLFCHEAESALTGFGSLKPPNPSFVKEGNNITLGWNYTIDGSIGLVKFVNVTDGVSVTIATKFAGGDVNVVADFQERFSADISDTLAQLTILTVQRSDSGSYEIDVTTISSVTIRDTVKLMVQYPPENVQLEIMALNNKACQGDVISINCSADPNPSATSYELLENDTVILNTTGIWSKTFTTRGVFIYKCVANNSVGTQQSASVAINVNVPSTIDPIQNETVTEGGSVTLTCQASGTPTPMVSWIKANGQRINGSELQLTNINRSEAGEYSCEASNECGNATETARIDVQYPAEITDISGNLVVNENDVVILNCTTDGEPKPNITWTRVSEDNPVNFTFIITGKQDEGLYRCTADNGVGNAAIGDVFINVQNYHPVNINLTTDLSGNSVLVNTTFNITCSAQASPPAKYRFYKDQANIINDTTGGDVSVITTLVSERVKQVNYSCTPFNDFGEGQTEVITLMVLFPPEINYATPDFEVVEDHGAILFCNATGNPQPNITWTKQGNNSILSTSETLNLTKLMREDDGSVYKCTVTNEVGSAHASTTITVLFPPMSTIHNCLSEVTEGDNVTLYCNATGNPPPKVDWIRPGEALVKDSAYIISAINRSQTGIYQCMAWNGIGNNFTANCSVDVQYQPNITTISRNQIVNESDTVTLNCTADGYPTPNMTWTRVSDNSSVNFPLTITGKQDEGGYRCTADNGVRSADNRISYIFVENYHPINPNMATDSRYNSVTVNTTFNITCSAQANPAANYRFYRGQDNFVNVTSGRDFAVINTSVSERVKQVNYSCIPFNYYGDGPADVITVVVQYAPGLTNLTTDPSNTTLLRGSIMSLNCRTDASPEAEYYFFFNGNSIGKSSAGVFNVTVEKDGEYICVPNNTVGAGDNDTVSITTVVAPSVELSNTTAIVVERKNVTLTCNASGKPDPSISWTKLGSSEVLSNTSSLTIVNVSRPGTPDNMIQYECTASNGVETPATATVNITVHYPALITNPGTERIRLTTGKEVEFSCVGVGNPKPNVTWTFNGVVLNWSPEDNLLKGNANSSGSYGCTIENYLGVDSKFFHLVMEAKMFLIKMKITNKNCDDNPQQVSEQLRVKVLAILEQESILNITVEIYKCGSITVYFSLEFTRSVAIPDVLSVLKNATEHNAFGEFVVDRESIEAISDDQVPTEPSTSTQVPPSTVEKSSESPCTDSFIQEANCDLKLAFIIIIVVVGVIVISLAIGIVTWWVHKRRKCRKHNEIGSTPSEEQPFSRRNSTPADDNPYSQVNNGYADAGPRSTEMTEMSQHQGASSPADVPDHAVVDKKVNNNDEKVAEQKPPVEAEYAQLDKSKKKKKKKEEPDATYAQVDISKKTKKKKPNPGEVLYADLGEFNQMPEMPKVSTSPQPLPPIKKPTPYVETQYADITQFLKGDAILPASSNGQEPAASHQGASLPDSNDGQEPAAGTKEDAPAANTSEAGKANNETVF